MEPETLNMLLAVFCFCFFCACACVCMLGVSLILKYGFFGLLDSVEPPFRYPNNYHHYCLFPFWQKELLYIHLTEGQVIPESKTRF